MAYFAAHNLPWVGAFSFTRETIAHGAAGARVGGFGGLVGEFIDYALSSVGRTCPSFRIKRDGFHDVN